MSLRKKAPSEYVLLIKDSVNESKVTQMTSVYKRLERTLASSCQELG